MDCGLTASSPTPFAHVVTGIRPRSTAGRREAGVTYPARLATALLRHGNVAERLGCIFGTVDLVARHDAAMPTACGQAVPKATLIDSGWYPPEADTPDRRLRYYARQFPLVEVDATYYALPAEQTAAAWAARTPARFTFNVKAFSLFTQHPTRVAALPADLRPAAAKAGKDRIYLKDVDPAVADQAWDRF